MYPWRIKKPFFASKSFFPWNNCPSGLRLYLVAIYWHFPICRNTTIFIDIRYGSLAINCNSKYLAVFSFVISCQIIWNYFLYLLTKREVVHKRSGAVFAESFNKYSLSNGTSNYRHGVGKVKHHSEILPQFCLDFFYPAVWRIRKQSWTGQNRNVIQHVQSFCPWSSRGRIMSSSHVWYRPETFQNAFSLVNIAIQISCTQSGTRSSLRLSRSW